MGDLTSFTSRVHTEAILDQIEDLHNSLRADGYELRVDSLTVERLQLSVVALDDACEECLVPKRLMQQMIATKLSGFTVEEIEIRYQ